MEAERDEEKMVEEGCVSQSLKGIRTQMKNKRELKRVCDHIVVCLILHNLYLDFRDKWENDEEEIRQSTDTTNGNELRTRVQIHVLRKRLGLLQIKHRSSIPTLAYLCGGFPTFAISKTN